MGSGITEENVWRVMEPSDGAITGTSLKEGGDGNNKVEPERVRRMAEIFDSLR